VSLGLGAVLASPPAARAQTFYGLAGGLSYGGPEPSGQSYTHGFAVQASVGRQFAQRLGVRIDAFTSGFDDIRPIYAPALCAVGYPSCHGP
jgi:hypothetical protein